MLSTPQPKLNTYPWCVVRLLPNLQRQMVAQFHRRDDADGYLRTMQRLLPAVKHAIVYQAVAEGAD
jgi:hypothetical protein